MLLTIQHPVGTNQRKYEKEEEDEETEKTFFSYLKHVLVLWLFMCSEVQINVDEHPLSCTELVINK
jgi:hypothetical protein